MEGCNSNHHPHQASPIHDTRDTRCVKQHAEVHGIAHSTHKFCCLYTKMKTQKRKTWQDGRLVISGTSISLYDAYPPLGAGDVQLDQTELSGTQLQNLLQRLDIHVETEKFLIQIEGPWQGTCRTSPSTSSAIPCVSKGMHKVMTKKFQKPGSFVPPNPFEQREQSLGKRMRAPLQPGDLTKRYYGGQAKAQPKLVTSWNQQQSCSDFNSSRKGPLDDASEVVNKMMYARIPHDGFPVDGGSSRPHYLGSSVPNEWKMGPPLCNQLNQNQVTSDLSPEGTTINSSRFKSRPDEVSWSSEVRQSCVQHDNPGGTPEANFPRCTIEVAKENRKRQGFVSNSFNAGIYFGEEDESSDEDGTPDQFQWNNRVRPQSGVMAGPADESNPFQSTSSLPTKSKMLQLPAPPQHLQPATHDYDSVENDSEALSRNQLLALLGGGTEFADSHVNVSEAANKPSVTTPLGDVSQASPFNKMDNQMQPAFEFVLPSASDSSSDENDDGNHSLARVV